MEGRTFDAAEDDLSTQFIAACVPAQIKVKIEQTTRVAAWSVVQDRLLLVQPGPARVHAFPRLAQGGP